TRPRSYCLTILTLTAAPAKPIAPSTASTSNNMTTYNAQHPGPGGKSLLEAGSEVARCLHGSRGLPRSRSSDHHIPDARGLKRACHGVVDYRPRCSRSAFPLVRLTTQTVRGQRQLASVLRERLRSRAP